MIGVAQKLSPPRPFEFWKRNSCSSVNFEARRMFRVPKFSKNYFQFLVFYHFLLSLEWFLYNLQKRDIGFPASPSCWSFWPSWGGYWEHNIAFLQIVKKPLKWEQKVINIKNFKYFLLNFGTLNILLASKLTELWLFLVQNWSGRSGLSFWARNFKLSNSS